MTRIAVIALNASTREFDKRYHYTVPEELDASLRAGMRVIVPFGKGDNPKEAMVFGFEAVSDFKDLKCISKILDSTPVLTQSQIELVYWMKQRYFCTYGQAVKCMLPAGIGVKSLHVARLVKTATGLAPARQEIIDVLEACDGVMEVGELKDSCGAKSGFSRLLRTLSAEGFVEISEQYSQSVQEKKIRVACLAMDASEVQSDIDNSILKRIQQIRVLEMLMDNAYISVADLVRFAAVSPSVLDTLRKYGYIRYEEIEVHRDPMRHREVAVTIPMVPTAEQAVVIKHAAGLIESNTFSELLLHGVTGSGKTEVYLQLIQRILDAGKQAIVLVPEISLTPQMVDRFRGRFGERVAVQHSRLSMGERYDQWRLIRDGSVPVVVGARSAIFAPLERLGIVIIDEEHENSYKSETTPKYSAIEIAVQRCRRENALLIYGSATPSMETYHRAVNGEIGLFTMNNRTNASAMPEVRIIDMRKELEAGNRTIFSDSLSKEIERNIAAGEQTILFLNRRGYASFLLCRSCGTRVKCRHCNITMTYHQQDNRLICHYCGYTVRQPAVCPECGSSSIRQFGTGTQKVEEELLKRFPGCTVIRMDMDTTTGKRSHEEILDAFRNRKIDILVGTQMIAKGHDFPNVTLVGVLAADSLLGMEDYRASERTFQLITQVAGRAGRGARPGRAVIQTYNTEDYSIIAACSHDYAAFYRQESDIRSRLNYPPYVSIGIIVISAVQDKLAFEKAKEAYALLSERKLGEEAEELLPGPLRAPLLRLRNRFRWRIVVKSQSKERLTELLTAVQEQFYKGKRKLDIDLNIDIDPVSMM